MHTLTPQVNRIKGHICQHTFSPPRETNHYSLFQKSVVRTQPSQLQGRAGLDTTPPAPRTTPPPASLGCSGRKPSCSLSHPLPAPTAHMISLPLSQNRNTATTSHTGLGDISFSWPCSCLHACIPCIHGSLSTRLSLSCSCSFIFFTTRAPVPSELPSELPSSPFPFQGWSLCPFFPRPASRVPSSSFPGPGPLYLKLLLLLSWKESWPEKCVSSPLPPPLLSGTQKGTEAPDGLVLAEGLREAAAHRGPCWAFELVQAAARPSRPAGRGVGPGASLLSTRPAPPASPSCPACPQPAEKQSVTACLSLKHRGRGQWPVGTLGFPRKEKEWLAVSSFHETDVPRRGLTNG